MSAVAKAWLDGDVIVVEVEYHEKALIQAVPASKWSVSRKRWEVPAAWGNALALRGSFGAKLELDESVNEWGRRHRSYADEAAAAKNMKVEGTYGYQEAGSEFLCVTGSALLGDEMGLGKSKQVIDAIAKLGPDAFPVLVVCPNSVKQTWKDEWAKWYSNANVAVLAGSRTAKEKLLAEVGPEAGSVQVVVVNWESLRTMSRLASYGSIALTTPQKKLGPLNVSWGTVVADEAHRAKEPKSQQTRALWAIGNTARYRFALTGTPVANSPEDLWAVMHFVCPEEWPSKTKFIDRYCLASFNFWGGMDIDALRPDTRDEMLSILDTRFIRRTKAEVLPFLPPITRQTRWVEMEPKQAKAYKQMQDEMIAFLETGVMVTTSPMTKMLRLLQVASAYPVLDESGLVVALEKPSCKVTALKDILEESPREQFVVFTVSRKLADLVHAEVGGGLVTGEIDVHNRAEAVSDFQAGNSRVITLTTGAGAEGLTLTAASKAIFLQRPWSMVQSLQAEARIHRIGQEAGSVEIIDLVATGTVEEAVARTLAGKEDLLQEIVRDSARLVRLLKGDALA